MLTVIGEESTRERMVIDPGETEVFTFVVRPDQGAPLPLAYTALIHDKKYEWTAQVVVPH